MPDARRSSSSRPSSPVRSGEPSVAAALGAAIRHLDAAVAEQEAAVTRILGLVELLLEKTEDRAARARLEGILEACGFQDLTGQRITKVNRLLRYMAKDMQLDLTPQEPPKPPQGLTQEEVDRLLRGETLK